MLAVVLEAQIAAARDFQLGILGRLYFVLGYDKEEKGHNAVRTLAISYTSVELSSSGILRFFLFDYVRTVGGDNY